MIPARMLRRRVAPFDQRVDARLAEVDALLAKSDRVSGWGRLMFAGSSERNNRVLDALAGFDHAPPRPALRLIDGGLGANTPRTPRRSHVPPLRRVHDG